MNKLCSFRLLFIVSGVCVTASFLAVLLLTYFLVVPYRLATELILTKCTIVALTPAYTLTKPCAVHMIANSTAAAGDLWLCLNVTVSYNTISMDNQEHYHIGVLSNVATSGSLNTEIMLENQKEVDHNRKEDCCSGCLAVQHPDRPGGPYTSCTMILSHQRASRALWLKEQLYCYYQRDQSPASITKHKIMVNVVFWPTLVFITGFVTMFLSYIKMQHEAETKEKKKRKEMSLNVLEKGSNVSL